MSSNFSACSASPYWLVKTIDVGLKHNKSNNDDLKVGPALFLNLDCASIVY